MDVQSKLASFRFVNAHLEAFGDQAAEALRYEQAGELLEAQKEIADDHGDLPIVYVGDYNSNANGGIAYERLLAGVGYDTWLVDNPGASGFTCCFDAEVDDPAATLESRIDLVLVDENVDVIDTDIIGDEVADMFGTPPLWPSDHAGVVATLEIDHPSAWRADSR